MRTNKALSNQALQATAVKRLGWHVGCQRPAVPELIRSANISMKTIVSLIAITAVILTTSNIHAAPLENDFVRKPGQYSLDAKGSTLTITEQPARSWSLKVMWRSGDATDTTAPDDCLRAEGWFVFVEKPGRLWIYDGREGGILVIHSEKQSSVSAFSSAVMSSCTQKALDALPQSVREKYRKAEPDGAANRSQPVRSETNRTSAAAGSGR